MHFLFENRLLFILSCQNEKLKLIKLNQASNSLKMVRIFIIQEIGFVIVFKSDFYFIFIENEIEISDQIESIAPAANREFPIDSCIINFVSCQNHTCLSFHIAFSSDKKPKRKKVKRANEAEESGAELNNDAVDGESNVMPTPPPSKRQKKRQKKEQNSIRSKDKEIEKTIAYLNKWDVARNEWKYEKLRQIHIQKNIFDASIIPDESSDVAIRYLSTSKVGVFNKGV